MKVEILECDHNGFAIVGEIIKLQQGTPFSHYAISFKSETGNTLVLDATSKNVAVRSESQYIKKYNIVNRYHVELDCSYIDFCKFYEKYLGVSYGFLQLIGILLKNKSLGAGIICNELVLRMLSELNNVSVTDINIRDLRYTHRLLESFTWQKK